MLCPTCPDTRLLMMERSGVTIDYCPRCRGVWLERGELEALIERARRDAASPALERRAVDDDSSRRYVRGERGAGGERQPRRSWLTDFFD